MMEVLLTLFDRPKNEEYISLYLKLFMVKLIKFVWSSVQQPKRKFSKQTIWKFIYIFLKLNLLSAVF